MICERADPVILLPYSLMTVPDDRALSFMRNLLAEDGDNVRQSEEHQLRIGTEKAVSLPVETIRASRYITRCATLEVHDRGALKLTSGY